MMAVSIPAWAILIYEFARNFYCHPYGFFVVLNIECMYVGNAKCMRSNQLTAALKHAPK